MPTSSRRSAIAPADDGEADQRHQFQDDLVACAHRQLLFLTLLHSEGISIRRPKVASLRRYVRLWLPLVAKHTNPSVNDDAVELIPPADVAYLWHVHRLAPRQYKYHIRSTGLANSEEGYLDANPPFALQFGGMVGSELDGGTGPSDTTESLFDDFDIEAPSAASSSTETSTPESVTRELWGKEYPGEPFFLEGYERDSKSSLAYELNGDDDALVSGYDLLSAAERQSSFLWQVSRSCFRQDKFLREGVDRYRKFLLLWKSAEKIHSLIPTYQIDVIWHSHMLSSTKKYDEDCKELIGCEFDHDDSLDDRSEGSSEFSAFHATKSLWERTYGTKYQVKDAMYRGPPPSSYFSGTRPPHQGALDGTHRKISPSPNATTASSAWNNDPYPHTPAPPRPTSIPSSQRQAPTASERKVAQCKLLIFGIAFVGIALFPLLYSDQDCSDCNKVDPCPDDQENSRPEDFAARVVVAVLLFIPGLLLLFCALKPSESCIMSCTTKGGGGGGGCGGGGCGGGGCGGC